MCCCAQGAIWGLHTDMLMQSGATLQLAGSRCPAQHTPAQPADLMPAFKAHQIDLSKDAGCAQMNLMTVRLGATALQGPGSPQRTCCCRCQTKPSTRPDPSTPLKPAQMPDSTTWGMCTNAGKNWSVLCWLQATRLIQCILSCCFFQRLGPLCPPDSLLQTPDQIIDLAWGFTAWRANTLTSRTQATIV
jgi:hypothetical protein